MLQFATPTPQDIDELVANMRDADRAECVAAGQTNLQMVVARGVKSSAWCETVRGPEGLICILGVAPLGGLLLGDTGVPWLLGTPLVLRYRSAFIRLAPSYIARMLHTYPHLMNAVHARNARAVRWLRRAGFTLDPAAPAGPFGEPFHFFRMDAPCVNRPR